jgi:RNA polymerase sigma-70 factor (ECF subfamily)
MTDSSDCNLVTRTLRGDTHAFGILVRRYQNSVFNVCYRLLGESREAEDLTQEAFIRAYQRLKSFDPERPFGPWMRRVAANLCYNHLQKNQLPQTLLDDELEIPKDTTGMNPEHFAERSEQNAMIRAALLDLPPHYRISLELRHFQELSYEEMAIELDLPLNTVKSHLFRARKQLAKLISSENKYA